MPFTSSAMKHTGTIAAQQLASVCPTDLNIGAFFRISGNTTKRT